MTEDPTSDRGDLPHDRGQDRASTARTDAASPWPDHFPERRDPETLRVDALTTRQQVGGLVQDGEAGAWRRRTTRLLVDQRREQSALPQIELLRARGRRRFPVVRGEILVRSDLRADVDLWNLLQRWGKPEPVPELDGRLVRVRSTLSIERLDALARFLREAGYEASVNHVAPLQPLAKGEGGPEPTKATVPYPADQAGRTGHPVTVAVIDTGLTASPRTDGWLGGITTADGADVDELDVLPADLLLDNAAGHGTFAAGIVAQVAPMVGLVTSRAVQSDGIGDEVDVALAIVAAARAVDAATPLVINLSLGAETVDDQPLLAIEVALEIAHAEHPDILVVAAAGNSGSTRPCFPAASRSVVAVAALDADLALAEWSNRGFWVDCAVIGEGILSTFVAGTESVVYDPDPDTWTGPNPWALWSGTSFAAPQIAGAVARYVAENGGTTRQALAALFATAPRVPDVGHLIRLLPGTPRA